MMPMLTGLQLGANCCLNSLTFFSPVLTRLVGNVVTKTTFSNYLNNSTGTLHERIISVVVEPMIILRMREWP